MGDSADANDSRSQGHRLKHPNRREFLKYSAFGVMAAARAPALASEFIRFSPRTGIQKRANIFPGRIVILHDADMLGHQPTIDRDRVADNVLLGVRTLTNIDDTAAAFESLFPGLHNGSTIAIKINCVGPCDTRWETARGVVWGLSQMLNGTYNVNQVTIFDQHNLFYHGYNETEFTFNGNHPWIRPNNGASGSGHIVWVRESPYQEYELSQYILDADYVIDMPVPKTHVNENNQITCAMKNHYGSCAPSSLCGQIDGMLALTSDPNIKDKTCLVVTDGIRGIYTGAANEPAQIWNTFPEGTPNTLFFTTDIVTNEYWARDLINSERQARDLPSKPCPWIELASEAPYNLGVSDPAQMTVLNIDPDIVAVPEDIGGNGLFFAPNVPNPFPQSTTLRFRLPRSGHITIKIVDLSGRVIRRLCAQEFPHGYNNVHWDGRDLHGRKVPTGVYLARLEEGRQVRMRRITLVR